MNRIEQLPAARVDVAEGWHDLPSPASLADRLSWYAAVARWAPSKHNTQPWRIVPHGSALQIWADRKHQLAETDPHQRELVISCGAALHLACVAMRSLGFQPIVTLLPDGEADLLAVIEEGNRREPTALDEQLLHAVPLRRTDRGPLDAEQLSPSLPFELQSAAVAEGASFCLVAQAGDRATLANLVERADRLLVQRPAVNHELARWLRSEGDDRPDGVPTDHTRGAAASYRAEFVQRDFSGPQSHPAHDRGGPDRPLVGVLCTPHDRIDDWLVAGRALASLLLVATTAGAAASYLNQPIEQSSTREQLATSLGLEGAPQLVLRLGRGGFVSPTPRRWAGASRSAG